MDLEAVVDLEEDEEAGKGWEEGKEVAEVARVVEAVAPTVRCVAHRST